MILRRAQHKGSRIGELENNIVWIAIKIGEEALILQTGIIDLGNGIYK